MSLLVVGSVALDSVETPFDAAEDIVYVVRTERGRETLAPTEFARRHGWKNDTEKVGG